MQSGLRKIGSFIAKENGQCARFEKETIAVLASRKRSDRMTMQDAQSEYFAFMGDSCGVVSIPTLSDIEKSIGECKSMLDYAIYRNDRNEISFWRRMIQTAKVQRRELLAT